MKVRINGCPVNLQTLTPEELENLLYTAAQMISQKQRELETLVREKHRRRAAALRALRPDYVGEVP